MTHPTDTAYPPVYHAAHNHVTHNGLYDNAAKGRRLIATALWVLRANKRAGKISDARLQWERDHFKLCGHPINPRREVSRNA